MAPTSSLQAAGGPRRRVTIHADAASDHPYRAWIDTYASEAFEASVQGMLALTDRLAETSDDTTRAAMRAAFARSSWHEWMFWRSAYRRESWPGHGEG